VDGQENFWQFLNKCGLLLRREHQVTVALTLGGERGKDSAANPEVRRPHVGTLFRAFEAKSDPAKISSVHPCAIILLESFR
jgi:hypothetical protein